MTCSRKQLRKSFVLVRMSFLRIASAGFLLVRLVLETHAAGVQFAGVNLAGAEFTEHRLPGAYGNDYIYPSTADVDYFLGKGMNLIRRPFRWERLQHSTNAPFNGARSQTAPPPRERTTLERPVVSGQGCFGGFASRFGDCAPGTEYVAGDGTEFVVVATFVSDAPVLAVLAKPPVTVLAPVPTPPTASSLASPKKPADA